MSLNLTKKLTKKMKTTFKSNAYVDCEATLKIKHDIVSIFLNERFKMKTKLERERSLIYLVQDWKVNPNRCKPSYDALNDEEREFIKSMGIEVNKDYKVVYGEGCIDKVRKHFQDDDDNYYADDDEDGL